MFQVELDSVPGTGEGNELIKFIVSQNLHRRHLNSSQKAVVALSVEEELGKLAKEQLRQAGTRHGRGQKKNSLSKKYKRLSETPVHAATQAARIVGTNPTYVSDAPAASIRIAHLTFLGMVVTM